MKPLRSLLVFCLYLAVELMSPVAGSPVELLDRGAEESVELAGQRRVARLDAERGRPVIAEVVAGTRSAAPRPNLRLARARGNPVRKVPAPAPESSSAPEDH